MAVLCAGLTQGLDISNSLPPACLCNLMIAIYGLTVTLFQLIIVPEILAFPDRVDWGAPDLSAAQNCELFELIPGPSERKEIN